MPKIAKTLALSAFIVFVVSGAGLTPTASAVEATTGLVGAWSFDEASGLQVVDQSGSGNNGTLTNITRTSSGRFGGALSFDGADSIVTVPSAPSLELATGMTLEAWVRPTATLGGWRDVIYKGNDDYYLMADSDRGVPAGGGIFGNGPDRNAYGDGPLASNVWTHLATTYDGSAVRLYVNGRLAGSRVDKGEIKQTSGPLQIGGDSLFGRYFGGDIDEVRVYDHALSESEIQRDMTTPVTPGGDPPDPPDTRDTQAPTAPSGLAVESLSQSSVALTWNPSTDNVGVAGYDVLRNGVRATTVTTTSATLTSLVCGTAYAFAVVAVDAAGNRSPQAQTSASTSACSTAAPTLQEVDGGAGYYGRFTNGLPSDASYFPIGVWFESVTSQNDVNLDKDVGLNTYVVLTGNSNLSLVRSNGMKAFLQSGEWRSSPAVSSETAAWELKDEIDMQRDPAPGCAELKAMRDALPADGRMRYNNFGKGVAFWETSAEAACYVNAVDLPSDDVYWFTDPHVCGISEGGAMFTGWTRALTATECRRASNYGAVVSRVRSVVSPARSRPVWNFVEVGHPFTENDAPTINGPQIRAAVWHSIIAGARGILYFNHNFGGGCQSQHVLRDGCGSAIRPTVKAVNQQIQSIARALNGPSLTSGFIASPNVKALAKWDGSNFYVLAGSTENVSSTASFSLPCVGAATATVLGENRTLAVNAAGSFTDSYADGNAIHLYRIDGGSTCGLN